MTGMQRMVYLTEMIEFLRDEKLLLLAPIEKFCLTRDANAAVSARRSTWYEEALQKFATASGVPQDRLLELIDEKFNAPESTKYLQLGNPEDILIASDSLASYLFSNNKM